MTAPAEPSTSQAARTEPARGTVPSAGGHTGASRLPDFFIIGHEKCGTTALYRILQSHPQVFMPELKEPRFFSRDLNAKPAGARAGALPRTLEAYLELFDAAGAERLAGEASPQYIRSAMAAVRIAELQPQARVIAILREPVAFLRSFHMACVRSGQEDVHDLRRALELEPQRRRGERIPSGCFAPERLLYSEHVRYVEQLRRFEAALSPEQVHVVVYEDLRRDNEQSARAVLRFLGLDDAQPIDLSGSAGSVRKSVRSPTFHRLAIALKRSRRRPDSAPAALRALDSLMPAWLEGAARRAVYAPPAPLDEQLASELRRRFDREVAALGDHLHRDLLSEWGYRR